MTRDEVLREFSRPYQSHEDVCGPDADRMADEIVRLREQLAAVTVTEAMEEAFMAAYAECEFQNGGVFTHRMGINAGITAALTAASEGASA